MSRTRRNAGDERGRQRSMALQRARKEAEDAGDELLEDPPAGRGNWGKLVRGPHVFGDTTATEPTIEDVISEGGCRTVAGNQ